jgi:dihydrofolate reductase
MSLVPGSGLLGDDLGWRGVRKMRKLVVNTFLTLDGVMQAPGGPEEDPTGGFAHGGWSVNYWDEVMGARMDEFMGKPFDLLLGRRTYEIFAAHWPHVADDPAAEALNAARKYVASRTLERVEWQNSTLLEGDVVDAVARLRAEDGPEIQVHGSGDLVQTLLEHDLSDELRLWFFPLVLGEGKRLFAGGTVPRGLKLVDSTVSTTGVLMSTYEAAGEVEHGSFALEEPTDAEVERRERLADG